LGNIVPLPYSQSHKNPTKDRWLEPSLRRQKMKAKERPKDTQSAGTKKKERVRVNPSAGAYTQSTSGDTQKDDFSLEANTKCFCSLVPV